MEILRKLSTQPGGFTNAKKIKEGFKKNLVVLPQQQQQQQLEGDSSKQDFDILFKILDSNDWVCHRKFIWAFLLGVNLDLSQSGLKNEEEEKEEEKEEKEKEEEKEHRDERQVELDVNRSFVYYPTHVSEEVKKELRKILKVIIIKTLRKYPKLNYFQGYHDIVSIFILNFLNFQKNKNNKNKKIEIELLEKSVQKFTLHRIRDSMTKDLSPVMGYLRFTQAILYQVKPRFARIISQTTNLPIFTLSWILTLTSHDIKSLESISRIFDFLLCYPPIMICYLASAICLEKSKEIDRLILESHEHQVDLDMVHFIMSSLPSFRLEKEEEEEEEEEQEQGLVDEESGSCSIEEIIKSTLELYEVYPPDHSKLRLNEIMGAKSCIHTWYKSERGELSDEEAEKILDVPLVEIVKPLANKVSYRIRINKLFKINKMFFRFVNKHKFPLVFFGVSCVVCLFALKKEKLKFCM